MGSIITLLVIVAISLWIVQTGAIALRMTGLDAGTARFQSLSAFFGVGYTTHEAELIVNHPVRRRIISHLIIAGNIGLTSALGTLVITFIQEDRSEGYHPLLKIGLIIGILVAIIVVARIGPRIHLVERLIRYTLRQSGYVHPTDYEVMLRIHEGFGVGEVHVPGDHWLVGKTLADANPQKWRILVMGITRANGDYEPAPDSTTLIAADDMVAVYGPIEIIRSISEGKVPDQPAATGSDPAGTTES